MTAVLVGALLLLVFVAPAHAYVDPGSGSMLVQLILGGAMAAIVMFRSFLHRLRHPLRRSKASQPDAPD